MMISRQSFRTTLVALSAALIVIPPVVSYAADVSVGLRTAIVPFVNYTSSNEASDSLMPLIENQIQSHGFLLVPHDTLRNLMRRKRIRMTGAVPSESAKTLAKSLNLDFLVTGSLDFYEPHTNPEAAISLRVFDCHRLQVVWASSSSVTGKDSEGMFGVGRVGSISALSRSLVEKLFKDFPSDNNNSFARQRGETTNSDYWKQTQKNTTSGRVAIIPFDNFSNYLRAGDITSGILLSELWAQGHQVVEPGDVQAVLAELRAYPRGELSIQDAAGLHDRLNVDLIITGSIYRYISGMGIGSESGPEVELSMRLIDAVDGKVASSVSKVRKGSDSEGIFGTGVEYSLGEVTRVAVTKSWKDLVKRRSKSLAMANKKDKDANTANGIR